MEGEDLGGGGREGAGGGDGSFPMYPFPWC